MAPGVPAIEGSIHGHDVIPVKGALEYFKHRGFSPDTYATIENILSNIKPSSVPYLYVGSTRELNANRVVFGEAVSDVLDGLSKEEAARRVMVIDSSYHFFDYKPCPVLRPDLHRRSGGLDWFEGDPSKTSRSLYSFRNHGTRKFLRCGRLRFQS